MTDKFQADDYESMTMSQTHLEEDASEVFQLGADT